MRTCLIVALVGPSSFKVGAFNFGAEQAMATSKKKYEHIETFGDVCARIVDFTNCDFLFGCDVGAFRSGLTDAGIVLKRILRKPFGDSVCCSSPLGSLTRSSAQTQDGLVRVYKLRQVTYSYKSKGEWPDG